MEGLEMWQREKSDVTSAKLHSAFPPAPISVGVSMSVPHQVQKVQQGEAYWKQRALQAEARAEKAEARANRLESEAAWMDRMMCSPGYSPSVKVSIYGTKKQMSALPVDMSSGLRRIFIDGKDGISDLVHLSRQTVGDNLQAMEEAGVVVRKLAPETSDGGMKKTHLLVAFTPEFEQNPDAFTVGKQQGGKRVKKACPSCGGSMRVHRQSDTCTSCGTVYNVNDTIVDDPQPEYVHPEMDTTPDPEYDAQCQAEAAKHQAELPTNVTPIYPRFYVECPFHPCPKCGGSWWKPDQDGEWRCSKCYPAYFRRKDQA